MGKRTVAVSRVLAGLFPTVDSAVMVAAGAEVPTGKVNLSGGADVFWFNLVREAEKLDRVSALIESALEDYPNNASLKALLAEEPEPVQGPLVGQEMPWKSDLDAPGLERLMGDQSTFLPVNFLEAGVRVSRAVGRVLLPDNSSGTGFLTAGNLLVTNHHVIDSAETAERATLELNYQQTLDGTDAPVTTTLLSPASGFATSAEHDVTVVRVDGDLNGEWGSIPVEPRALDGLRWVNIVQHPGGGPKQVAIYHNLVSHVDDDVLQYYTDTMPGSSGSPVFDSSWHLVALHHSGGWIREPNTNRTVFRNEGINVGRVAEMVGAVS